MYLGQIVVNSYGSYFPILFKQLYAPLESFPWDEALDILAQWGKDADQAISGVQYVLVDEKDVPLNNSLWEQIAEQTRLVLIENIEGVRVYTIR